MDRGRRFDGSRCRRNIGYGWGGRRAQNTQFSDLLD
jgi:hypothetical protein